MLPLVLLLAAADPSPTLQAIVALGRGNADAPVTSTTKPSLATPPETPPETTTALATTATASAPAPRWAATKEEPSPLAGLAALFALAAGAGALWWRKRSASPTSRILRVQETVAVGKGRALMIADVGGRRVLLSSSEAGVALLLDLGTPRPTTAPAAFDSFADTLAAEMTPVTVSGASVDVEGHEIQRRLEMARRAS